MDYYIAGSASGIIKIIIGHPLDTLKIWKQNKTVVKITPSNLYRGIAYPLLTNTPIVSINMGVYHYIYKQLAIRGLEKQYALSGAIAGLVTGPLVAMVDVYKINKQMKTGPDSECISRSSTSSRTILSKLKNRSFRLGKLENKSYKPMIRGDISANTDINTSVGSNLLHSFKTLTRGMGATIAREFLGFAFYFHTYYWMRDYNWNPLISGGVAGLGCWLPTYPLDVIKTRVQSGRAINMTQAFKQGNLWGGLGFCLSRAFLANAIGFYAYESCLCALK